MIVMDNRIKEIRKKHGLSQEAFGAIINTTQQAVSKMENNTYAISSDLLIRIAEYFNVTTDYILGLSNIKQDLNGQICMNQETDQCCDIARRYQSLSEGNKKTIRCMLKRMERAQQEEMGLCAEEVTTDAKDSNM